MKATVIRPELLMAFGLLLLSAAAGHAGAGDTLDQGIFATVDDIEISGEEYLTELQGRARQKFYHGKTPEPVLQAFRRDVGAKLIERRLLDREAKRRGVQADEDDVAQQLSLAEQRYSGSPQWAQHRERILNIIAERLRTEGRIAALEASVRELPPPTEAAVRAYYEQHPDKFTTPERLGISIVLLRVAPSATSPEWEQARVMAEQLAAQLRQGADFAELARQHSQDPSAEKGGDLGYVHHEMLGGGAQEAIDRLRVGESSAPVQLLEGYALFRLNARKPPRLNPLPEVQDRAAALWLREAKEEAWRTFTTRLHQAATIRVNEHFFAVPVEDMARNRVEPNAKR